MLNIIRTNSQTFRELFALSIPVIISQGAFAVMIFTDRYFMSQISPTHMAAAMGGGVTSFFSISLFIGILSYANALVAQYYGGGQREKCPRVVTQGLILCLLFIPLLMVIAFVVSDIFVLMGHETFQAELEKTYFLLLMACAIFTLCKTCMGSYFSGIGRTKVVMVADTLGVALNIPLSYLLIFGKLGFPEMGIVGAGIGTIISTFFSLAIFAFFYWHKSHRELFNVAQSFVYDGAIIRRYVKLGLPSGIEMFLNMAAFNLFLLLFQSYGIAAAASAAIVFNWDILSFIPMIGLNIAIISLSGRFIGAGEMDKTQQVMAAGFVLGIGYSAILAVLFLFYREPLVGIFISPGANYDEIKALSNFMMIGLSSYVMADAIILVASGILRGAGDTRWLMIASVSLHWLMLIGQFIVIKVLNYGPKVVWTVFVAMIITIAVVYVLRLRGQKWRDPKVLSAMLAQT